MDQEQLQVPGKPAETKKVQAVPLPATPEAKAAQLEREAKQTLERERLERLRLADEARQRQADIAAKKKRDRCCMGSCCMSR